VIFVVKKFIENGRGKVFYWISEKEKQTNTPDNEGVYQTNAVGVKGASLNKKNRTIMFTHGVTADHTLFNRQVEYFEKDYTVLIWDMPLHGESTSYKNFTFANVAEDMKQILNQEHISHAVMAGQSAGGYAVQAFILKYPEMADAFISIDSSPFGLKYYKKSELFWTDHFCQIARLYPYEYYCKASAKAATNTEESRKAFYDCLKRLGKQGMLNAADAVYKDFPNYEEVSFKCPVLLLLGQYDKVGLVKKYNEMWSTETGYPLMIIPNAAHNSNYDNYEFFNVKVYEFLKDI
jgi:pimeloyl-ACP methyl ester carboxylesterase